MRRHRRRALRRAATSPALGGRQRPRGHATVPDGTRRALAGQQRLDGTSANAMSASPPDAATALCRGALRPDKPRPRHRNVIATSSGSLSSPTLRLSSAASSTRARLRCAARTRRFIWLASWPTRPSTTKPGVRQGALGPDRRTGDCSSPLGDVDLVNALGSFRDGVARDDIRQFFAGSAMPAAARMLDQALERIDHCAALKTPRTLRARQLAGRSAMIEIAEGRRPRINTEKRSNGGFKPSRWSRSKSSSRNTREHQARPAAGLAAARDG